MKKTAAHSTTNNLSHVPESLGSLHIGREFLDTTWRIAVPVILFAAIGIFADKHLGTKPWLTLLGVLIGFTLACLLVRRQLLASEAEDEAESKKEAKQ